MSQHWYQDGDLVDPWTPGAYPSVSTILDRVRSDSYEAMVARMGQEAADELMAAAAARGTRVHKACELWGLGDGSGEVLDIATAGKESGLLIEEVPYLQGFIDWYEQYDPRPVANELFVVSEKYKYAGRLDLVVIIDGQHWIIDIKTGVDSVRHGLQLKLYQQAYYEMSGIRARMGVLALDAKRVVGYRHSRAPFGLKEYREPWAPCEAHIKVFKWWNRKNPIKPRREEEAWSPVF